MYTPTPQRNGGFEKLHAELEDSRPKQLFRRVFGGFKSMLSFSLPSFYLFNTNYS